MVTGTLQTCWSYVNSTTGLLLKPQMNAGKETFFLHYFVSGSWSQKWASILILSGNNWICYHSDTFPFALWMELKKCLLDKNLHLKCMSMKMAKLNIKRFSRNWDIVYQIFIKISYLETQMQSQIQFYATIVASGLSFIRGESLLFPLAWQWLEINSNKVAA